MKSSSQEEILSALTSGFFSRFEGRFGNSSLASWMDAALDTLSWKAVTRRDSAALALVELAKSGDEASRHHLLRLLSKGPPHVRVALVRALPDESDYPTLAAAWKGSQQNFWRGSARFEKHLRRLAVALACAACVGTIILQNAAAANLENVKHLSKLVLAVVAAAILIGASPFLVAWAKFPCRPAWRSAYYTRLAELLQLDLTRGECRCLPLLPEVQANSEIMNGESSYLGKHFHETAGMIRSAAEQRSSFPIPSDSRQMVPAVLPIPAADSSSVAT